MSFEDLYDTTSFHENRIKRCRSCNAQIVFLKTGPGNSMPTDADTVKPEDTEYDSTRHMSHFATCTNPDRHRKPRQ